MKKLIFIFLLFNFFVSCSNKNNIEIVINDNNTYIYAIDYSDDNIKKVIIDYKINDYKDIFELYTIYKNRLPSGYYVNSNSNITLINSYVKDNDIYYIVDKYIYLTLDIGKFVKLLTLSNKLLGYDETFIICGNKTFGI